jgi:hypothetical protein
MQEFRKSAERCVLGLPLAFPLKEEIEPKQQNSLTRKRSSTELRFASFLRSIVKDPGRLSRVKMNALAGALDSLPGSKRRRVRIFRLTRPMTS